MASGSAFMTMPNVSSGDISSRSRLHFSADVTDFENGWSIIFKQFSAVRLVVTSELNCLSPFPFSVISVGSVRDLIAEVRSKPKIFTQNATSKTFKIQRKTEQPPRVTRAIFPQDIQGLARGLLHGGAQG